MEKAMGKIMTAAAETRAAAGTMTNFRWKIAFLIFLISFVAYMDRVNLSVATPVIMQEFGFTKIDMGFIQTCFFASYALMQVPVSWLKNSACARPGLWPFSGGPSSQP